MSDSSRIDEEVRKLRDNGLVLPKHPYRAVKSYGDAVDTTRHLHQAAGRDLDRMSAVLGRRITSDNYDSPEVQEIVQKNNSLTREFAERRANSRRMEKVANLGPSTPMGGDIYNAIPRFYDPLEYWDISGLPWNVADEGHRHKLHKWMRLYYATHYLVPILIDIFTRFPLVGMELECTDPLLKDVYEDIFLNNLKYEDFFVSLGREFWCVGEAFPLGSFDEDLGVWEHEELINPEDVVIDNFPLLNSQQLKIVPPDYLRRIAQTKSPAREWYMLQENYEELIPYLLKGEHIPISPVMLRQVANKLNDWDDHGTPILLRGLRTLLHEEKLLASQDAIAERLYSPFILAKLGIMDMGDGLPPWLPTAAELESVRDDIDMAMASDFRVMVHHFGLEMTSVFGREQMPRLGDDFDRIERRLMQVFGVNPSLLSAGSNSQPYASSALQAEFMNQILRTFQKMLKSHYRERALVVAEAQGHYAYEKKGKTRIPIMEDVVYYDDEGNKEIKREHKLLVPELAFASFDLRDEATERQFLQSLRMMGVPIPNEKLLVGVNWDMKDLMEEYNEGLKEQTIIQQRTKLETYTALTIMGLPVPMDLKAEVESILMPQSAQAPMPGGAGAGTMPMGGGGMGMPHGGPGGPPGGPGGGPGGSPIVMPNVPGGMLGPGPGTVAPGGGPPPIGGGPAGMGGNVPPVSNERRPGLTYNTNFKPRNRQHISKTSAFGEFMNDHPELGVAFQDYVVDHNSQDRDSGELNDVPREEVERLYEDWPNHSREYESRVAAEILYIADKAKEAEDKDDNSATIESANSEDFKLKANQELLKDEEDKDFILEKSAKRRIYTSKEEGKRYSVIDPLAPELGEDDSDHKDGDPEPSG